MASLPVKQTPVPTPSESVEARFRRLAGQWKRDTAYISSSTVMYSHPAYREIITLGEEVMPLLLRDMEEQHTHWFEALREITGADPCTEDVEAGNIPQNVEAWLRWAKEKGYRW